MPEILDKNKIPESESKGKLETSKEILEILKSEEDESDYILWLA